MDGGEKVACGLVITGSDGAELFEFTKEVLDPVACWVEILIVFTLQFAIGFGWNHRRFASPPQRLQNPLVGVIAFIGQHDRGLQNGQQCIGSLQIAGLSGCQQKAGRVAQGIDGGMDFRAQPAFAATDGLVFPVFF
jgi:hypothetical protein